MTRFHSKSISSKGLQKGLKAHKLHTSAPVLMYVCQLKMHVYVNRIDPSLPNWPCGNNAMSSSRFVPRNTVWKAIVPLTVVNVVVLGAIVHQATIGALIGASPGTQEAYSGYAFLAITFSSWHCSKGNSVAQFESTNPKMVAADVRNCIRMCLCPNGKCCRRATRQLGQLGRGPK